MGNSQLFIVSAIQSLVVLAGILVSEWTLHRRRLSHFEKGLSELQIRIDRVAADQQAISVTSIRHEVRIGRLEAK